MTAEGSAHWATEFTLSTLPPNWIPPDLAPRPPLHHFRQPPLDGASGDGAQAEPRRGDKPLVYATLGTVYWWDHALRTMLLDALSGIDADVLMTVGRRVDPARIIAPPNVRIEQYVPQSLVLPQASAVVCHAGLGTMIGAIAAGLPMVLIDLGTDHAMNAARAADLGIATSFERGSVNAQGLRGAIEEILDSPGPTQRAQALAAEYQHLPPSTAAVEVLTTYVDERRLNHAAAVRKDGAHR